MKCIARCSMLSVLALGAFVAPGAAAGGGHGGDIQITLDAGRLVTGLGSGGSFTPERVFASNLGEVVPNIADEPGFSADSGTFTPGAPGASVGFDIPDALRVWNGADFSTVSGFGMTISYLTFHTGPSLTPGEVVVGFDFVANASGGLHAHPIFRLNDPASDGVYLLQLRLRSPGLLDSEAFYIVFNQNADEAVHDAAIQYVRDALVPAPGAAGAMALAGAISLARRRRRS